MRLLPAAESGLWLAFQGLITALVLADFGLGFVLARQAAHSLEADETSNVDGDFLKLGCGTPALQRLNRYSSILYRFAAGAAVCLGVILFEEIIPRTHLLSGISFDARWIWYVLMIVPICLLLGGQPAALLAGIGRTHIARFISGAFYLTQGIAVAVALALSRDLLAMAICSALIGIIYVVLMHSTARRLIPGFGQSTPIPIDRHQSIQLLRTAAPMGIVNVGAFLVGNIQVPMLGALLGPSQVAPFYLAQKFCQFLTLGAMQPLQPHFTEFTRFLSTGNRNAAWFVMRKSMLVSYGLLLVAAAIFIFASPTLAHLLSNSHSYPDRSILSLMALDMLLGSFAAIWGQFVMASGKNPFMASTLFAGFANLFFLWLLIPSLGLAAIPISALLSGLLTNYWLCLKHGLRLREALQTPLAA